MRKRTARRQITDSLNARRESEADIHLRIYLRPEGARGQGVVRRLCSPEEIIANGPQKTWTPGSVVTTASHSGTGGELILSDPLAGARGGGSYRQDFVRGSLDFLAVDSATPSTVEVGVSGQAVTLNGSGFRSSPLDVFTAVVYSESARAWVADPFVTITTVAFVSESADTVSVDVSASAPIDYLINVKPSRG